MRRSIDPPRKSHTKASRIPDFSVQPTHSDAVRRICIYLSTFIIRAHRQPPIFVLYTIYTRAWLISEPGFSFWIRGQNRAWLIPNMSSDTTDNAITSNNGQIHDEKVTGRRGRSWPWSGRKAAADPTPMNDSEAGGRGRPTKWSMGVLNDPTTHEVPGMPLSLDYSRHFCIPSELPSELSRTES